MRDKMHNLKGLAVNKGVSLTNHEFTTAEVNQDDERLTHRRAIFSGYSEGFAVKSYNSQRLQ